MFELNQRGWSHSIGHSSPCRALLWPAFPIVMMDLDLTLSAVRFRNLFLDNHQSV